MRYLEDKPYEFTHDFYRKGGNNYELVSRIRIRQHPPLRLSAIFGEALYATRSALDHFIHQLAIDNGASGRDLERIEFPIFIDPDRFKGIDHQGVQRVSGSIWTRSGLYKTRSINPSAQAIIERLQPYQGRDCMLLWHLQEFSNIDKHRHLHLLTPYLGRWHIGRRTGNEVILLDEPEFKILSQETSAQPPMEDGAIILRSHVVVPDGFDFKVSVHHAISNDVLIYEQGFTMSAGQFLAGLEGFVRKAVFPQLTQFLR
jgi:hypothetical protein